MTAHAILSVVVSFFRILFDVLWDIVRSLASNWLPYGLLPRYDITGKVILLTGSGSGMGREFALRFSRMPITLVLWDIDERGNEETARKCREQGVAKVHTYTVDVTDRAAVYATADMVRASLGRVYMVVNNAGVYSYQPFLSRQDEQVERTMHVNALAHAWMAKAFLPDMVSSNEGHIVCIASLAGIVGAKNMADYSCSKYAAMGLQEALENELCDQGVNGVHFTTVCSTFYPTDNLLKLVTPSPANSVSVADSCDAAMDAILTRQRISLIPRSIYAIYALKGMLPRRTFQKFLLWKLRQ